MRRFFFFCLALLFPAFAVRICLLTNAPSLCAFSPDQSVRYRALRYLAIALVFLLHGRLGTLIPKTELYVNNNRKCIKVTLLCRTNFHFQSSRVDRTLNASGRGTSRTWKRAFGNVKILNIIMHNKVSNYLRIGYILT